MFASCKKQWCGWELKLRLRRVYLIFEMGAFGSKDSWSLVLGNLKNFRPSGERSWGFSSAHQHPEDVIHSWLITFPA